MRNLVILLVCLFLIVNITRSLKELTTAGGQVEETEKQVEKLRLRNEELKKQKIEVQKPSYLEKVARDKLGMAKEGEVIIVLPPIPLSAPAGVKEENIPNWKKWYHLFF